MKVTESASANLSSQTPQQTQKFSAPKPLNTTPYDDQDIWVEIPLDPPSPKEQFVDSKEAQAKRSKTKRLLGRLWQSLSSIWQN